MPPYPNRMTPPRIRLTTPVRLVLDVLAHAKSDEPVWGYRLCEITFLGSGTIYPILERLEAAEHVRAYWEEPRPADRPPRRFYELTGTGRELAAEAMRVPVRRWRPAETGGIA
jgi:PadR family transcriptional regulator, regulatory protein PadR